jgi:hypothetical protein
MKFALALISFIAAASALPALPTNGQNVGPCSQEGAMSCYGMGTNGFITCDNGQNVYRDCGPGTTCQPPLYAGGPLFCGYPGTPAPPVPPSPPSPPPPTTPTNGQNVGPCSQEGAMSCYGLGTNGFITCDNGQNVYRDCGPGTTCQPPLYAGGPLFCGYP